MDDRDIDEFVRAVQNGPFKELNALDYNFLSGIYRKLLIQQPSESHKALHLLRSLQQHNLVPNELRHGILQFLQWSRELLLMHWGLYTNYGHAFLWRDNLQNGQPPTDLVSLCISECSDCFMELIRTGAIYPCYYNRARQSLFYLAFRANKMDIAQELLSMLSPEQILDPAYIVPGYCPETIFQLAASHQDLFNTCWAKVESDPRLTVSDALDYCHRASICQFATAQLASSMLGRGINLASTVKEYALPTWNEIALHHPDPEPLFNWLSRHECRPPPSQDGLDTPLIITARHDRAKETNWLLYHSCDERERWICAMEAATRQTDKSVYILEIVMKRISLSVLAHRSETDWVLKIANSVVQGTCNHARDSKLEGVDIVERRAIQKVGCINAFGEDSLLFPSFLISDAREANLSNLADFLQIHNSETRRTIALV